MHHPSSVVIVHSDDDAMTLLKAGHRIHALSAEQALALAAGPDLSTLLIGPCDARPALIRALAAQPHRHIIALTDDPQAASEELIACLEAGARAVWPRGLPAPLLTAMLVAARGASSLVEDSQPAEQVAASVILEQDRRFRAFADAMPFILWTARPDGVLDYASRTFYDLTGADAARPIGDVWLSTLHPDDAPQVAAIWTQHIQDELPYSTTFRLRGVDGSMRWHHAVAVPVRDAQGRCTRWSGAVLDIHETKELEQRANRVAERLHATLESITDGFLTLDRDYTITYINSQGARLLGTTPETLLHQNMWAMFPAGRDTVAERAYHAAMTQSQPQRFEFRDDHMGVWLDVRAFPAPDGLTIHFSDVAERRGAELRLHLLQTCVERMNDIVLIAEAEPIDAPGPRIVYANAAFERLTGYAIDEILGKTPRILQGAGTQREALDRIRDALIAWQPVREEVLNYTKDGRELWLELDIVPVADERGWFTHWVAIERDITERKRAEAHLLRTQRMESIGTLAGGIAHDLNNVLTPILGTVSLLRAEETHPERLEDLATIESCVRRGADMIRQLLAFARGNPDLPRVAVSVEQIAAEVVKLARETFPKDIAVRLERDRSPWHIQADATQLHQLLTNLCVNARDAMPTGGILPLTVRGTLLDEVYAGMNPHTTPGPYVVIQVEDTGTGMAPELVERIFEPFFTTKEPGKGTGLGLSTCHAIARNHGGFIHVYSEPGKGSRFKVYLPADVPTSGAGELTPDEQARPRGRGELVLVVDDEETVRKAASKTLERYGYRVLTAQHGAEAISIYAREGAKIALVLTDMSMPIMDGPATIIALKALNPRVRIVSSSGLESNGKLAKAVGAGVHHFVPKPYTAETLLQAVRAAIDAEQPNL